MSKQNPARSKEPSLEDLGLDEPGAQVRKTPAAQTLPPKSHTEFDNAPPEVPFIDETMHRTPVLKLAAENETRNTLGPASPPQAASTNATQMLGLLFTSWIFIIIGVGNIIWYQFMETTVEERLNGATQRIYNTGLQQEQLLGFMWGLAAWLAGTLTLVIRTAAKAMINGR